MTDEKKDKGWEWALGEAPASVNFYGVTAKGWNCQFTLRDADEGNMMVRFAAFVKVLEESHVTPKAVGAQPQQVVTVPALAPDDEPPELVRIDETVLNADGWFDVTEVSCSLDDGQERWRVKGGNFTKWGVVAYPEVFANAGLKLDPLEAPHKLAGWKAYYINNPETGSPKKVIALRK